MVETLKTSSEFKTIAGAGRKWVAPGFIFQIAKSERAGFRAGFTCSRKLGNAVRRNRIKRRLRALAAWAEKNYPALAGHDSVFIGRPAGYDADYAALQAEFQKAMKKFGFAP